MKVKDLIKELSKLDGDEQIYSSFSMICLLKPKIKKNTFVCEEINNGEKVWITKSLSDKRPKTGKFSSNIIEEKEVYII